MKILIMALLLVSCVTNAQETEVVRKVDYHFMKSHAFKEGVQLLDVRTPKEYKNGRIANAKNLDIRDLQAFKTAVAKLDKSRPVYLYCHVGGRSNKAAGILEDMGFTKVYDYTGGYSDWATKTRQTN